MQKREADKSPCQPKTAKRFFGGPVSHGPSGQAKERTRILPVRRVFSAPGVPRHVAGWSFLRGLPLLWRFLRLAPRHFSAGVPLSCPRLAGSLLLLRLVWPVLPGSACRLPAVRFVCARIFSLSFAFSCLAFLPLKSLFTCRSGRDGPLLSSEKKVDKDSRGERRAAPLRTPLTVPCGCFSPSLSLLAGLTALRAANRRLTGKRLKSPGAELSFSSVSVRRGTSAPCGCSPPLSRCWPA